jgi:hypothetical protein
MPPVNEQLALPGSVTNPEFAGARFLLKPGRKYQEAVDLFSPYDKIKEPYEDGRTAAAGPRPVTRSAAYGTDPARTAGVRK